MMEELKASFHVVIPLELNKGIPLGLTCLTLFSGHADGFWLYRSEMLFYRLLCCCERELA